MLNSLSKFGSRINKSVKYVMDCSKREEADWFFVFFFSSIFVGGLMGGYKMLLQLHPGFNTQQLAAVSEIVRDLHNGLKVKLVSSALD